MFRTLEQEIQHQEEIQERQRQEEIQERQQLEEIQEIILLDRSFKERLWSQWQAKKQLRQTDQQLEGRTETITLTSVELGFDRGRCPLLLCTVF